MTAPVDVLAVWDDAIQSAVEIERDAQHAVGFARAHKLADMNLRCDRLDAATGHREDMQEARAAVAELIEAADGAADCLGPTVTPVPVEVKRLALARLAAAIARCGCAS